MIAAAVFLFCCVLGVQGVAAQLLPRRIFLRASGALQMAAFCLFVGVYFLQPPFPGGDAIITAGGRNQLALLPSYWFLGVFHSSTGRCTRLWRSWPGAPGSRSPSRCPLLRRRICWRTCERCGRSSKSPTSFRRTGRGLGRRASAGGSRRQSNNSASARFCAAGSIASSSRSISGLLSR